MNYLVIDIEATCWEKAWHVPDIGDVNHVSETIEIGAVMVDDAGTVLDTFQTFIKPIINTKLSDFCKELTTIKQEDVDEAPYFNSAMLSLMAWIGDRKPYVFCSWGDYDKNQLTKDCQSHGIIFPLGDKHINLKDEYARITGKKKRGIKKIVASLGWEWEGIQHRGIDDAKNMARVIKTIIKELNDAQ